MKINTQKTPVELKKTGVTQKKAEEENITPQDTVDLKSSEPSLLRKGLEGAGGLVFGVKNAVTSALPGSLEGSLDAASKNSCEGVAYGIGKVVQGGLAGAGLGYALGGGGWAMAGAALGGTVLAGLHVALMSGGKSIDRVGDHIEKRYLDAVADYKPTGDKIHNVTSNFVRGGPSGLRGGVEVGWQVGKEEGKGAVSGLIEGLKGTGSVIAGSYEDKGKMGENKEAAKEEAKPGEAKEGQEQEKPSVLGKIGGAIQKGVEVVVGVPSGLIGAALLLPVGPVQGFLGGAELSDDHKLGDKFDKKAALDDLNYKNHRKAKLTHALAFLETVGAGAAVGYLTMGGTAGALWGAGGGAILGGLACGIASATDRTEKFHEGVSKAVVHAYSDNAPTDSQAYNFRRDVTEGTITGLSAGAREGFKEGYDISKEGVEFVADGVKYVAKKVVPVVKNVVGFGAGIVKGGYEGIVKDKVVDVLDAKENPQGKGEEVNEN